MTNDVVRSHIEFALTDSIDIIHNLAGRDSSAVSSGMATWAGYAGPQYRLAKPLPALAEPVPGDRRVSL